MASAYGYEVSQHRLDLSNVQFSNFSNIHYTQVSDSEDERPQEQCECTAVAIV